MRLSRMIHTGLLGLALTFGLTWTAHGQQPLYLPVGNPAPSAVAPAPQVPYPDGAMALPPAAHAPVVTQHPAGDYCPAECCVPTKKICVSEAEKYTKTHTCYSSKCRTICLPSCCPLMGKKCDSCEEG